MSQGFEIIRARVKDDAVVLIDRLMRSKQVEVVLVLPKNSIVAADLNSLKILKEEAESVGKTLSLNTDNEKIKSFAQKIGMLIYNHNDDEKIKKAELAKTSVKMRILTDILPPHSVETPEEDITAEIPESQEEEKEKSDYESFNQSNQELIIYDTANKNSDLEKNIESFYNNENNRKKNGLSFKRITAFFTVSGLVIFGLTMYLILPKASIRISLKEVSLKTQIPVAVSKNVTSLNLANGIIPGQYFSLSKTGSKTLDGSFKIGGVIEIYNAYRSTPQKLISGTRFETKDGKIFRIKNSIIIPGAKISGTKLIPSSIKVNVTGDEISDDYLIGPNYFTIPGFKESPKYAGFYAKSAESMTKTSNISLNEVELLKNKEDLSNKLAQELKIDTLNNLKNSGLRLIDGASLVKIEDFKINSNVLNMKITWQALSFKEKDLRTLINYFVSSHFVDLKDFTFEDNIVYPEISRIDFKKGELFFTINIDKNNALPADINNLRKELAGQNENEMRAIISDKAYINGAAISLWPFWVKKAPSSPEKINITIDNK